MCHWNITFPEPLWIPLFHWCHATWVAVVKSAIGLALLVITFWICKTIDVEFRVTIYVAYSHSLTTPLVQSMCWKDVLCKAITTFGVHNWYWIFQNLMHDHHSHEPKWFPMHLIFYLCSNFLFTTLQRWGDDVLKTEIFNYGHQLQVTMSFELWTYDPSLHIYFNFVDSFACFNWLFE